MTQKRHQIGFVHVISREIFSNKLKVNSILASEMVRTKKNLFCTLNGYINRFTID